MPKSERSEHRRTHRSSRDKDSHRRTAHHRTSRGDGLGALREGVQKTKRAAEHAAKNLESKSRTRSHHSSSHKERKSTRDRRANSAPRSLRQAGDRAQSSLKKLGNDIQSLGSGKRKRKS